MHREVPVSLGLSPGSLWRPPPPAQHLCVPPSVPPEASPMCQGAFLSLSSQRTELDTGYKLQFIKAPE